MKIENLVLDCEENRAFSDQPETIRRVCKDGSNLRTKCLECSNQTRSVCPKCNRPWCKNRHSKVICSSCLQKSKWHKCHKPCHMTNVTAKYSTFNNNLFCMILKMMDNFRQIGCPRFFVNKQRKSQCQNNWFGYEIDSYLQHIKRFKIWISLLPMLPKLYSFYFAKSLRAVSSSHKGGFQLNFTRT